MTNCKCRAFKRQRPMELIMNTVEKKNLDPPTFRAVRATLGT